MKLDLENIKINSNNPNDPEDFKPTEIRGIVKKIYFSSPGFSAGIIKTPDGEKISFAGKLCVHEEESIILGGRWTTHPTYGRQFEALSLNIDTKLDAYGLKNFLAKKIMS